EVRNRNHGPDRNPAPLSWSASPSRGHLMTPWSNPQRPQLCQRGSARSRSVPPRPRPTLVVMYHFTFSIDLQNSPCPRTSPALHQVRRRTSPTLLRTPLASKLPLA